MFFGKKVGNFEKTDNHMNTIMLSTAENFKFDIFNLKIFVSTLTLTEKNVNESFFKISEFSIEKHELVCSEQMNLLL